ncbi:hypothetical protein FJZ28_02975, partial [Candidatus Peregrinibacteria bacterium]|nr:hypothetical protein [Candidatus Peregrinibacteria bacterium]
VSRASLYYAPRQPQKDWALKCRMEEILREHPSYGHKRLALALSHFLEGHHFALREDFSCHFRLRQCYGGQVGLRRDRCSHYQFNPWHGEALTPQKQVFLIARPRSRA